MTFVLDNSAAVSTFEYDQMLEFVINVVGRLDVDSGNVRVAVITFSDRPTIEFRFSTFNTSLDVRYAVRRLPYEGYAPNIGAALRTLRTDVFR